MAIALSLAGCSQSRPSMPNANSFYQVDADTAGVWETARPDKECRWLRSEAPNVTIADGIASGKVNPDLMVPDGTATVTLEAGDWFIYWDCHPWQFTGR